MTTKYESIIEPRLDEIRQWARESTDKEIAAALGVSYSGFRSYKKKHLELAGALMEGRQTPNYEVLGAFHKRATGFELKEVTKERIAGKLVTTKEVIKQVPPDTEAGKFWLKNRMPTDWKDRHDIQHSGLEEEKTKLDTLLQQIGGNNDE